MVTIIGVRFRNAGKIYYFDPGELQIARGISVIVETARGMEMGTVMLPNKEVEDEAVVQPLKPVLRIAAPEDFEVVRRNKEKEKQAFGICREKIAKHGLKMKLVDVEYTFDNNKILFYFTADGRIDFRELVKDLASQFKTRIELRQIGVRDETKILGGIGICGRCLCCSSYLADFAPVSIKMAKEQNLSLNPTKISGVCGRLMCCLKNEEETYEYLNKRMPKVGDQVYSKSDAVLGEVKGVNVLRQLVRVVVKSGNDDAEIREYPIDDLKFRPRGSRGEPLPEDWKLPEEPQKQEKPEKQEKTERPRRTEKPERKPRENNGQERRFEKRTEHRGSSRFEGRQTQPGRKDPERRERRESSRRTEGGNARRENRSGEKREGRTGEKRERKFQDRKQQSRRRTDRRDSQASSARHDG